MRRRAYDYDLIKELLERPDLRDDLRALLRTYNKQETIDRTLNLKTLRSIIYRQRWVRSAQRGRPRLHDEAAILRLRKDHPHVPLVVLADMYNGGRVGAYLPAASLRSIVRRAEARQRR